MATDSTTTQVAESEASYNPKMLAAKAKLLERFKREGEHFQPSTLEMTPAERAACPRDST